MGLGATASAGCQSAEVGSHELGQGLGFREDSMAKVEDKVDEMVEKLLAGLAAELKEAYLVIEAQRKMASACSGSLVATSA